VTHSTSRHDSIRRTTTSAPADPAEPRGSGGGTRPPERSPARRELSRARRAARERRGGVRPADVGMTRSRVPQCAALREARHRTEPHGRSLSRPRVQRRGPSQAALTPHPVTPSLSNSPPRRTSARPR
jgi:hypothetical protein